MCGHRLACLAQPGDRRPHLIGAGPPEIRRLDREHHALHALVGSRLVEPLDDAMQVRRHVGKQPPLPHAIGQGTGQRHLGNHGRGLLVGGLTPGGRNPGEQGDDHHGQQ